MKAKEFLLPLAVGIWISLVCVAFRLILFVDKDGIALCVGYFAAVFTALFLLMFWLRRDGFGKSFLFVLFALLVGFVFDLLLAWLGVDEVLLNIVLKKIQDLSEIGDHAGALLESFRLSILFLAAVAALVCGVITRIITHLRDKARD